MTPSPVIRQPLLQLRTRPSGRLAASRASIATDPRHDPPEPARSDVPVAPSTDASPRSFHELHLRYARMVRTILLARVPYDDVDDLAQDALLRAFLAIDRLRDPAKLGGWLATIAHNVARGHLRHRGTVVEGIPPDVPDRRRGGDRLVLDELHQTLRELPGTYRETLTLRLVEQMSPGEIADLTGMQPGSVRVNLHRGMRLLRARLWRQGVA